MSKTLLQQVEELFEQQLATWPMAADNFRALQGVEVKSLQVDGLPIKVQFNPARAVSSSAKIDPKSLKERKCFLCEQNRPDVQRGIEWGRYVVLINPFPIFPRHLTIPDRSHTDQLITGRIADMMRLAKELPGYTVFYNGPKCGASAPDHMHFQAGNSDFLTVIDASETAQIIIDDERGRILLEDEMPMPVFTISTSDPEKGQELFDLLYRALPLEHDQSEPMLNMLCTAHHGRIDLQVFPRKKHRPSFYGTEGDDTMLLSPASVDMGGAFITPRENDFKRLDEKIIRQIYHELCLSPEEVKVVVQRLKDE
ncbi:MAG: DUF4922 domain-containing protein [Bacteroidales bacterium]|nr:DUF4922 domain-containing protein [Bacteroidales bacterium]